ncbi:hypothetical protein PSHT_11108 [Puccinia striiformis]|uniref:phosphoacetylglucosamine mutase n=1 Tax=Puccinia striiformis TaxID=27350 RepID=A0A2S4V5H2_9BASI|nr:hypothetical protein PSHT_11108 [Puccinia striiformis]
MDEQLIETTAAKHPITSRPQTHIRHGWLQSKVDADTLDRVFFTVGLLAVLRSKKLAGQTIGVMVTASHNPVQDNGIKLVDPQGEMLVSTWESHATLLSQLIKPRFELEGDHHGLKTTPQLHYLVKCINDGGSYGAPTEEGYYKKLSDAFIALNAGTTTPYTLMVDCANGVGAPKLKAMEAYLKSSALQLKLTSTDVESSEKLNKDCGADYVKTTQSAPSGVTLEPLARACSYDGDADRIVYYYYSKDKTFRLMDGDKIATLVASYIKELGLAITCTPTGVKHLHHAAQTFDIGTYFEANGHGTVVFSESLLKKLPDNSKLLSLAGLINQTVGDSMSDMLLVETVLNARGWGMAEWDTKYEELPNRLVKVIVTDRHAFVTEDAERIFVKPDGMQLKINQIVSAYPSARSFVRPSGTEDCVRVYAEAATKEATNELAFKVAGMVFDFCGKGDKPNEFL